jgi:hypothetical protein
MRFAASLFALAALACGSIDSGEDPPLTATVENTRRSEVVTSNGVDINGVDINGVDINGSGLASTLVAVHLAAAELNGAPLTGLWLVGGELRGSQGAGAMPLGGTELVGLRLQGERGDGSLVTLRLKGAADAGAGGWRYDFVYRSANNAWAAVCAQGPAVIVGGRWNYQEGVPGGGAFTPDPSVFTIGCPHSAVEKCVVLGYRPWIQFGTVPGVELHTSCVRAIRADYCGDGRPQTTNGRLINIYDNAGVQADTEAWRMEAEWIPAGARCVSPVARGALGITCSTLEATISCGDRSHFDTGTRLMTETQLGPIPYPLY